MIEYDTAIKTLIVIIISLLISMPGSNSGPQLPSYIIQEMENTTRIRFYVHDVFAGDNQTVYQVAQPNTTGILPPSILFGVVFVLDNPVTEEPEIESKELGRLQGMATVADLKETGTLHMMLNLVFTQGEHKGSTLSIFGRNPLLEEVREVSIVGGTGGFRLASGYVNIRTHAVEEAGIHFVYEYEAVVHNTKPSAN